MLCIKFHKLLVRKLIFKISEPRYARYGLFGQIEQLKDFKGFDHFIVRSEFLV